MLQVIAAITGLVLLGSYVATRAWWHYSMRRIARRVFRTTCRMYATPHEWRTVDARAFPNVDHAFYADQQAWLTERGFRWLADLEDATARALTGLPPTFLRLLVGPDGTTLAGVYHLRITQRRRQGSRLIDETRDLRMLEFVTYLNNGMSISTAPLNDTIQLEDTPGHVRRFVPPGLPREDLLERHHAQVQTMLRSHSTARPAAVPDLATLLALLRQSGERTATFRREIGFLTDDEVDRHAGNTLPRAARDAIKAEIARLRRRYLETGALP